MNDRNVLAIVLALLAPFCLSALDRDPIPTPTPTVHAVKPLSLASSQLKVAVSAYDRTTASWNVQVTSLLPNLPVKQTLNYSILYSPNLAAAYAQFTQLVASASFSPRLSYRVSAVGGGIDRYRALNLDLGQTRDGKWTAVVSLPFPEASSSRWLVSGSSKPVADSAIEYITVDSGELWKALSYDTAAVQFRVNSFDMAVYPVSQGMFADFMGYNPSVSPFGRNYPVEGLTQAQAAAFCNELSRRDGLEPVYVIAGDKISQNRQKNGWRMPTWQEYQHAQVQGQEHLVTGWTRNNSNFVNNAGPYDSMLQPSGLWRPDSLGLYDLVGNVKVRLVDASSDASSEQLAGEAALAEVGLRVVRNHGTPQVPPFTSLDASVKALEAAKSDSDRHAQLVALTEQVFTVDPAQVKTTIRSQNDALFYLDVQSVDPALPFHDVLNAWVEDESLLAFWTPENGVALARKAIIDAIVAGHFKVFLKYKVSQTGPSQYQTTLVPSSMVVDATKQTGPYARVLKLDRAVSKKPSWVFSGTNWRNPAVAEAMVVSAPAAAPTAPAPAATPTPAAAPVSPPVEVKVETRPVVTGKVDLYRTLPSGDVQKRVDGQWSTLEGAKDFVKVDSDGNLLSLSAGVLTKTTASGTVTVRGSAYDLALGANQTVYVIGNFNRIEYAVAGGDWKRLTPPFPPTSIAAGPDGSLWALSAETRLGNGKIYRYDGKAWALVDGLASTLAIDAKGGVWVTNEAQAGYRWNGTAWDRLPGSLVKVFTTRDGRVFALGPTTNAEGNEVLQWTGSEWVKTGLFAASVASP